MRRVKQKHVKKSRFYNELAPYLDFICTLENRRKDVLVLQKLIAGHLKSDGRELLDVACGTGLEDRYLKKNFKVTGIDLNKGVLQIARKRNPDATYLSGNMQTFRLKSKYDVITCFDAMCYLKNYTGLRRTLINFQRHLKKGGLLIFYLDPIFLKEHHKQDTIVITKRCRKGTCLTLIEIYRKKRQRIEGNTVYIIQQAKRTRFETDAFETLGFFEVKRIRQMLMGLGFRVHLYSGGKDVTFSLKKYDKHSAHPVFVCET
jgi:ubiquinone/menaquinone biosynthesis C-methylase UbiE